MRRVVAGPEIERLIQLLSKLPGLGPRSARRAALHLVKKREELMQPLTSALGDALEKIVVCDTCGNIDTRNPCMVCADETRDHSLLVAVENEPEVKEVVLALSATVDGQTTAHYITDLLREAEVKITRLAHGVPVGGELDYLDEGTLSAAIRQRTLF
jgi:recombination protein RecR